MNMSIIIFYLNYNKLFYELPVIKIKLNKISKFSHIIYTYDRRSYNTRAQIEKEYP